jgi:hypothetical protein
MSVCTHCAGSGREPDRLELLKRRARSLSILILTGDRVREEGAAVLLDRSIETLKGWRKTDQRLPFIRDAANRITYALCDIADFLKL